MGKTRTTINRNQHASCHQLNASSLRRKLVSIPTPCKIPGVGIRITILGSGSAGNCTLIETDTTKLLVDAGLSGRQIAQRLALISRNLEEINGVVLTHEHSDHTRGLSVLCKSRALPIYANRLTAEAISTDPEWQDRIRISWRLVFSGGPFRGGVPFIASCSVAPDSYSRVGYVVRLAASGIAGGVLPDIGHATKLVT